LNGLIGFGVGCLADVAAVLPLLLLLMKNMTTDESFMETIISEETKTINANEICISEYGLGDDGFSGETGDDEQHDPLDAS
jgi:tartrate dehydratase alpha subunit/fumarate hydratase class I-like protein